MRKVLISTILGIFIAFNLTVALQFNKSQEKTLLLSLIQAAFADDEGSPNVCLETYPYEENMHFYTSGKCWRDAPGEDIYEGPIGDCVFAGTGCNAATCKSVTGCYTNQQ